MNKRNSQRIYNIKQGRNVSSGMSVASQDRRRKLLQINHLFSLITSDRKQQRRAVDSTKNGWFHSHKLQQDILRKSKTPSLLLIGDSIAYGFKRYCHIWEKIHRNLAVN